MVLAVEDEAILLLVLTGPCLAFHPVRLFFRDVDIQLLWQRFKARSAGRVWLTVFSDFS